MTFRAVLIGLLVGMAIALCGYYAGLVVKIQPLIGDYLAISLFGMLMIASFAINPLLGLIWKPLALSGRELAVVMTLGFMAGCMPGLLDGIYTMAIVPHQVQSHDTNWQQATIGDRPGAVGQIPEQLLVDIRPQGGVDPLRTYIDGMPKAGGHISITDIPWFAWRRPMMFWAPLVIVLTIALVGLALVFHPQWSHHERLRYPLALFAASIMPAEGESRPPVFRNGLFWAGAIPVFTVLMINYAYRWSDSFIQIPLFVDLKPLFELSKTYIAGCGGDTMMMPSVIFAVVGFTYFLASDVALSLGLGPHIVTYISGMLMIRGIPILGGVLDDVGGTMLFGGAWLGIFLMLLYTGRHYYLGALRRALGLGGGRSVRSYSVWGMRMFMVALAAFMVLLMRCGLDWPLAGLFTFGVFMIYVVIARLLAETGLYWFSLYFSPAVLMIGFMGMDAIGPREYMTMMMLGAILLGAAQTHPMPFLLQGLRMGQLKARIRPGRIACAGLVAVVLGAVVALPVPLYYMYDRGAYNLLGQGIEAPSHWIIDAAIHTQSKYVPTGGYPPEGKAGGLARLARVRPVGELALYFCIALALVLLFSAARLRFPWWPLHPVMFAVLAVYLAQHFAFSFLLGWAIKKGVHGFGGGQAYQKAKPLMIGIIAGDLFSRAVPMVIQTVYFFVYGVKAPV